MQFVRAMAIVRGNVVTIEWVIKYIDIYIYNVYILCVYIYRDIPGEWRNLLGNVAYYKP